MMSGNFTEATEPLAAKSRCALPSWIAAATAAAGARRLASGIVVMLCFDSGKSRTLAKSVGKM